MEYTFSDKEFLICPQKWNKNSPKEVLQYAVGGLLYMPATNVSIANKILNGELNMIKSLCLCLEDAIGDCMVLEALNCVKTILSRFMKAIHNEFITFDDLPLIFIRVRNPKQITEIVNMCGMHNLQIITGFNLPKFDKNNCDEYLENFSYIYKNYYKMFKSNLYIMPIIESYNVLHLKSRHEHLNYIADKLKIYADNVLNIRVGTTDFCNFFAIRRNINSTIYDVKVVSDCLADIINYFGASYICSGAVWEYFDSEGLDGLWLDGLKKELTLDKLNGFIGKTCIHPSQLPYIFSNNIVTLEEYKDAVSILGMSDNLIGVKKGYNDNKMNEVKTHTNWAKKIIGLSEVYGVLK